MAKVLSMTVATPAERQSSTRAGRSSSPISGLPMVSATTQATSGVSTFRTWSSWRATSPGGGRSTMTGSTPSAASGPAIRLSLPP